MASSFALPQSQNTAPVLEFRCLFTHDLRRKQKRYQDGRVKFHTFNKRVMVYDENSNFIGDTHWRKDYQFTEGEAVDLERSGVLVDVGECIGTREQDLTELVDKRRKEKEQRAAAKIATPSRVPCLASTRNATVASGPAPLKLKSLNTMLAATGAPGRASLPTTSPFEQKQQERQDGTPLDRPSKRRKLDTKESKSGYAQNLTGATLNLSSSRPPSTASIRYEPLKANVVRPPTTTIDLTTDTEEDMVSRTTSKVTKVSRKSPKVHEKYATKITGAPLVLNRRRSPAPNEVASDPTFSSKVASRISVRENSSLVFSAKDNSLTVEESKLSKAREYKAQKQRRKELRKGTPDRDFSLEITQQQTSGPLVPEQPERPTSALRIKTRQPKRLMMFMERPIHRDSHVERSECSESLNFGNPSESDDLLTTPNSKAASNLMEFLPTNSRPVIDIENFSSSPEDRGIDHHTIDVVLARRRESTVSAAIASPKISEISPEIISDELIRMTPSNNSADVEHVQSHDFNHEVDVMRLSPTQRMMSDSSSGLGILDLIQQGPSHPLHNSASAALDSIVELAMPESLTVDDHEDIIDDAESSSDMLPNSRNSDTVHITALMRCSGASDAIGDAATELVGKISRSDGPVPVAAYAVAETSCKTPLPIAEKTNENGSRGTTYLRNPATGGQSIQLVVNKTLDAIANPTTMPPPNLPKVVERSKVSPRPKTSPRVSRGSEDLDGPWSRESFDLFGSWRPPGRPHQQSVGS